MFNRDRFRIFFFRERRTVWRDDDNIFRLEMSLKMIQRLRMKIEEYVIFNIYIYIVKTGYARDVISK